MPCYVGTSVEIRAEGEITTELRSAVEEETETIDTDIRIKNELLAKQFELFAERNMI